MKEGEERHWGWVELSWGVRGLMNNVILHRQRRKMGQEIMDWNGKEYARITEPTERTEPDGTISFVYGLAAGS